MTEKAYWNPRMVEALGTETMKTIQLERLRTRVDRLFEHAPYFRRRMEAKGA